MSLTKKKKLSNDERINAIVRRMKPRTQIDDLEDYMDEYGAAAIVHDMMIIAIAKAENDRPWLESALALTQCLVQLERVAHHDAITSKRANRKGR